MPDVKKDLKQEAETKKGTEEFMCIFFYSLGWFCQPPVDVTLWLSARKAD